MHMLIAGAGGVLGRELARQALARGDRVRALVLARRELDGIEHPLLEIREADVTRPETLRGVCEGADRVISCVGITRLKGRMTHEDVDYRGNLNLLREAEKSRVGKFGFISPAGTPEGHREAPLLAAKHRFETALRASAVPWVIFRSGGFFSDLAEMKKMAARGPLFVIGRGTEKSTPIHVADLAEIMLADMETTWNAVVEAGGPEHLSWLDICRTCFEAQNRPPKIIRVPAGLCRATLAVLRPFSPRRHAMGQLLLFMSTRDVCTPPRGRLKLREYLRSLDGRATA
ncbi:MAG TPA: SDR family oxidoreductase [Kiritimatiellia bacterium]|nr:SDR family oxidoreductase [Kiritimatiellia bacterium]HRZ13439.1 SDR family oxidoreductase [Kiritimatiellia bacterium]HSA18921.1 SDR family oxidoreductase [Kiritimatiellia bacterium]